MKKKMVKVRAIAPNININKDPEGGETFTPRVGEVFEVPESWVKGGLAGKVRPIADEPASDPFGGFTIENATAYLEAAGFKVTAPRKSSKKEGEE